MLQASLPVSNLLTAMPNASAQGAGALPVANALPTSSVAVVQPDDQKINLDLRNAPKPVIVEPLAEEETVALSDTFAPKGAEEAQSESFAPFFAQLIAQESDKENFTGLSDSVFALLTFNAPPYQESANPEPKVVLPSEANQEDIAAEQATAAPAEQRVAQGLFV